jgi:Ca-activated chloride channel family protein
MKPTVRFEHELLAIESEHDVWCMLELSAPPAPVSAERRPLSISLVIDRSGSMAGRKLEVTRACAAFLVERMAPADRLSLVTYDHQVELRAPLMPIDGNRDTLLGAIRRVHAGGQTNLSGGWLKGAETLRGAPGGSIRRVLLLSDGLANVGITDAPSLAGAVRATRETHGVTSSTIGFGADFDEDLLAAMADAGDGSAHFAETPDDAPGIFAKEFTDLVSLVAQNVSVEIRPAPQVEFLGVLNEFPVVAVDGGVQVQLGEAFADERRRVVFQLHVPQVAALGVMNVAELVLRYVSVGEQQLAQHEVRVPLAVNRVSADEAAGAGADAEVTEEVVILSSARAGREARELADRGDFDGADRKLREAVERLSASAKGSARERELLGEAAFWRAQSEQLSSGAYSAMSRKQMLFRERFMKENRRPREESDEDEDRS